MSKETRVAVVTGSNKGIGLAIVKELCTKFDGHVYLTSRDESLGKAAVAELENLGLHPKYHQLDIDDESSVIKLRDYLKSTYEGLDVLVNNAAICFWVDSTLSFHERAVQTLQVNYFNTKRVCDLLFPILKPHARVVNMSSVSGHLSMIPSEELRSKFSAPNLTVQQLDALMGDYIQSARNGDHAEKGWPCASPNSGSAATSNETMKEYLRSKGFDKEAIEKALSTFSFSAYRVSKVGLNALTRIQQRYFDQDPRPDLIVNSVHPGYVDTDMTKHLGGVPIEQGAVAPSWLALLPADVDGPKGAYVWSDKQVVDWANGPTPGPY